MAKNYPVDGKKRNVLKIIIAIKARRHKVTIKKPFSFGAFVVIYYSGN